MSYTTYEARWFINGAIPADFETWFKQNCLADSSKQPEQRTDIYLYASGNDFVGIKLRQGRLEIKWRISELGAMQFGNSVVGKVEKWSKWMCSDSTGEAFLPSQVENSSTWLKVNKIRYSQQFDNNIDNIKNRCNVELTLLQVNNNIWWSVALEANELDNLCATANYLFNDYKGFVLQLNDSFAYPNWLGRC